MNPELQQMLEQIKVLADKIVSVEGGSDALMKAFTPEEKPEDKEKREMAEKATVAKAEEDKKAEEAKYKEDVEKAAKALIDTTSKGPTVLSNPKEHFEDNISDSTKGAINEIKKSVIDLCDIMKAEKSRTDMVAKSMDSLLKALGLDKVLKGEAEKKTEEEVVHKTLQNSKGEPYKAEDMERIKKSLEASGFKFEAIAPEDGDMAHVNKSQLSDVSLGMMLTGRQLRIKG